MAWWDTDWDYRIKITAQSSKVAETISDHVYYIPLSSLPSGTFWANVDSTGKDIRVTEGEDTQIEQELVDFDSTGETGALFFQGTTDSASDKDYYIYYGNSGATALTDSDTYGTYNCWSSAFNFIWHQNEDPTGGSNSVKNRVANTAHGTPQGNNTSDHVAVANMELEMKGIDRDESSSDYIDFGTGNPVTLSFPMTFISWVRVGSIPAHRHTMFGKQGTTTTEYSLQINFEVNDKIRVWKTTGSTNHIIYSTNVLIADPGDAGVWNHYAISMSSAGTSVKWYKNGAYDSTGSLTNNSINNHTNARVVTHAQYISSSSNHSNSRYQNIGMAKTEWSANRITTWYNNQSDPATFWSISSEESNGPDFRPQSIIIISS